MTFADFAKDFNTGLIVLPVIQFVQSISIAKAFGKIYKYEIDSTSELIALSCSNMIGSFFGGWPVTGSFSGSAVNAMSGTQTPFSSVIACGLVFLAISFLMPCFYFIPETVLGAMIVMAVVTMIDYKTPIRIWKVRKIDLIPYVVSFLGTFYTLETGVLAGAVVSLLVMVSYEVSPQYVVAHDNDNQRITISFKGNLSYPAIEHIKDTINQSVATNMTIQTVVLDMSHVYHIDYAIVNSFRSLAAELESDGIFLDFKDFIDTNVERSFQNGKVQRAAFLKKGLCIANENTEVKDLAKQNDDFSINLDGDQVEIVDEKV